MRTSASQASRSASSRKMRWGGVARQPPHFAEQAALRVEGVKTTQELEGFLTIRGVGLVEDILFQDRLAVTLFIPEAASPAIEAWFESCTDPLVSSDWIVTEFLSALSIKLRKGEISAKQAQVAWKDFDAFCKSGLRLLPVSRKAFLGAAGMARNAASGLRSGDALHLAMALEAGATGIATADETLAKNAKVKGLAASLLA